MKKTMLLILCTSALATQQDMRTCAVCSTCSDGMYAVTQCNSTSDTVCATCPANFFCSQNLRTPCPTPTKSTTNSSTYLDCRCANGAMGTVWNESSAECHSCPVGQFCVGVKVQCTCWMQGIINSLGIHTPIGRCCRNKPCIVIID